jgi:hypothetical protein
MATSAVQTFDSQQPMIMNPSEIRPGDWMRDLGILRQVEFVEAAEDRSMQGTCASIRFVDGVDGRYGTLSVPEGVKVTVWRTPVEVTGDGCV